MIIQKTARKHLSQKLFATVILLSVTMQSFLHRVLAKNSVLRVKSQRNSIIIQRSWQKHNAMKFLSSAKIVAFLCQCNIRGAADRSVYNRLNQERKAVTTIQSVVRCKSARNSLKARQLEVRDVDRLRQEANAIGNELNKLKDENNVNQATLSDNGRHHQVVFTSILWPVSWTASSQKMTALRSQTQKSMKTIEELKLRLEKNSSSSPKHIDS